MNNTTKQKVWPKSEHDRLCTVVNTTLVAITNEQGTEEDAYWDKYISSIEAKYAVIYIIHAVENQITGMDQARSLGFCKLKFNRKVLIVNIVCTMSIICYSLVNILVTIFI